MNEIDRDLQSRLKRLADEVGPDAARERVVIDRSRSKRRLVAMTSGLMCILLLGGIGGAAMLWERDGTKPAPPAHSECPRYSYDVAIFPLDSATAKEVDAMRRQLLADAEIEDAVFVSAGDALDELKERYADRPEFYESLPEGAMPSSFRVTLVEGADPSVAAARLKELDNVKETRTADAVVDPLAEPSSPSPPERCTRQPDLSEMTVSQVAATLFLDSELRDALPSGFSVDQIVRNGPEETNSDYATVGVRMNGPVDYARVIFFVHPDEPSAQAMYERELATARSYLRQSRAVGETEGGRPYFVANAAPGTRCGAGIDHLLACYALRGRVVMLTQSSAGRLGSQAEASEAEREAAETLARAFSSYLDRVYPGPEGEQVVTRGQFARYSFEAAEGEMSASGVMEVNSEEATICLEARLSNNIVTAQVVDKERSNAEGLTLVVDLPSRPDPSVEDPSEVPSQPSTYCRSRVDRDLLQLVIAEPGRFALDFRRGPSDDPGLIAELHGSPERGRRADYYIEDSLGFGVHVPEGWEVARYSLTPNLDDPREILSLGTAPMGPGGSCAHQPVRALEALGPTDAFITIQERRGEAGHPPRPRSFQEKLEDRFYNIDLCTDTDDFRAFLLTFNDAGRDFHLLAALGTDASVERTREFWRVLDSLDFEPPYDQD